MEQGSQRKPAAPEEATARAPETGVRAPARSTPSGSGQWLELQRKAGNHATTRLIDEQAATSRAAAPSPGYAPATRGGGQVAPAPKIRRSTTTEAATIRRSPVAGPQDAPAPSTRIRRNTTEAVIQRKMAFKSADLKGEVSTKAKIKGFFGQESTFSQLKSALATYEEADGWAEELEALQALKDLCKSWIDNHGAEDDVDDEKLQSIRALAAAVNLEIPIATQGIQDDADEQEAYVQKVKTGGLKYLSQGGKMVAKKVEKWKAGIDILTNQENEANKIIAQYGLTLAEAMAIGIYTADDYKYINPALAEADDWMQAMLPRLGVANLALAQQLSTQITPVHLAEARVEGKLQGKIAAAGMKKLPDWKGKTFRGLGLTPDQFAREYPPKGTAHFAAFSSTSLNEEVSRGFAGSNSGSGKVGILLRLACTMGKDVAMLSNSPGEKEILLMPGATFAVVKITDGEHRGKPIKIVDLKQTG